MKESHLPRIELKTSGIQTEVFIDGERLEKVRSVRLEHRAGELPILSVDYVAADLYLDGHMLPALPEHFRPYYEHKDVPVERMETNRQEKSERPVFQVAEHQKQREQITYHTKRIQELDKKLLATRRFLVVVCSLVSATLLVQLVHLWLLLSW